MTDPVHWGSLILGVALGGLVAVVGFALFFV